MGLVSEIALAGSQARLASVKAQPAAMNAQIASGAARLAAKSTTSSGRTTTGTTSSGTTSSGRTTTGTASTGTTSSGRTTTGTASTGTTSSSQAYTGGNKTISNYAGERIAFTAPYRGVTFSGSTYQFHSSSGTLTIPNVLNKVVDFRDGAGNVLAKAYATNSSGTIDGRSLSGYQFIVGSNVGSNNIYAGSYGSYLWGNTGNITDTLVGNAGSDTFFVGKGEGNDAIRNASSADNVNLYNVRLSDIVRASESNGTISLTFNTGNTISVQDTGTLSARFNLADGSRYRYNHSTKSWQNA